MALVSAVSAGFSMAPRATNSFPQAEKHLPASFCFVDALSMLINSQ